MHSSDDEWVRAKVADYEKLVAKTSAEKYRKRLEESCISGRALAVLESMEVQRTEALSAARREDFVLLVLSGGVGCGKTVAASWWLLDAVRAGRRGLIIRSSKLARWPRYDMAAMDRLLNVSRLAIDDIGIEYADQNGSFQALLEEILADRAAERRPTIITTNLSEVAFKQRVGARITDRIREAGRFVSLGNKSLRGAGRDSGL